MMAAGVRLFPQRCGLWVNVFVALVTTFRRRRQGVLVLFSGRQLRLGGRQFLQFCHWSKLKFDGFRTRIALLLLWLLLRLGWLSATTTTTRRPILGNGSHRRIMRLVLTRSLVHQIVTFVHQIWLFQVSTLLLLLFSNILLLPLLRCCCCCIGFLCMGGVLLWIRTGNCRIVPGLRRFRMQGVRIFAVGVWLRRGGGVPQDGSDVVLVLLLVNQDRHLVQILQHPHELFLRTIAGRAGRLDKVVAVRGQNVAEELHESVTTIVQKGMTNDETQLNPERTSGARVR